MILTAHQPVYLPWLGLFHKIACADTFVFFDDVQYLPRDWNNRNKIKTSQGPIWLTVPVLDSGHREKPIREIRINNSSPWRRKQWGSLVGSYARAPYFQRYASFFEETYRQNWDLLVDLNEYMLKWFLKELQINVAFLKASELHFEDKKSALVLDMCKKLGAKTFIFGEQGKNYADAAAFTAQGIQTVFQTYNHPVYDQLHGDFASHMSIVDLLFNHGPESNSVLLNGQIPLP